MFIKKIFLYAISVVFLLSSVAFTADLSIHGKKFKAHNDSTGHLKGLNRSKRSIEFEPRFFEQLVDHKSNLTFKQRYFVNERYYKSEGPVFLILGGEENVDSDMVYNSFAVKLAKRHKGIIYGLEHRYYGVSHPFKNISFEALKFLSTDYALKDIARFARNMKKNKRKKSKSKWFVFGYSYSGMLAAWSRQIHPGLFYGAYSSSAPVQVKEDFYEYDQVIQETLGKECSNKIELIVKQIDYIYENNFNIFQNMKNKMNCSMLSDVLFLANLSDAVGQVVQYNNPDNLINSKYLCESLGDKLIEPLTHKFIETIGNIISGLGETCQSFSEIVVLRRTSIDEHDYTRQWNYQTCTEFGFWTTAPRFSPSLRSKYLTVSWYNKLYCSEPFFPKYIGPPDTKKINSRYFGKIINTKRIIFTNGAKDPWKALSIANTKLSLSNRPIIVFEDQSHCSDYSLDYPSSSKDYDLIFKTFDRWINKSHKK